MIQVNKKVKRIGGEVIRKYQEILKSKSSQQASLWSGSALTTDMLNWLLQM